MQEEHPVDFDRTKINYTRFSHNLKEQFDKYLANSYDFLSISENNYTEIFRGLTNQDEINTFLEIDMDRILSDLNFHIAGFKDFNASADPVKVKELILSGAGFEELLARRSRKN